MDSCFSSDEKMAPAKKLVPPTPKVPIFSPPFGVTHNIPLFRQPLCLSPNFRMLMENPCVVRELRKAIASNVHRCLRMLEDFGSQNGILDKIMFISSHLQKSCRIPPVHSSNLSMVRNSNFAAILPGDSVAGLVVTNGISNFLNIYNTVLILRLVLTWFPNAPSAVVSPLSTLCDPYLNIFRGIIPPLGGLDLSPILAFLVLNAFTSTAAALPAELPPIPTRDGSKDIESHARTTHMTSSQEKWMRRVFRKNPKGSNGEV